MAGGVGDDDVLAGDDEEGGWDVDDDLELPPDLVSSLKLPPDFLDLRRDFIFKLTILCLSFVS